LSCVNLGGGYRLTLSELTDKYVHKKYKASFANLPPTRQKNIYLKIIENPGRARPSMNALTSKYSKLGRGSLNSNPWCAVYNISFSGNNAHAVVEKVQSLAVLRDLRVAQLHPSVSP
jgi:hypothetical protein